MFLIFVFVFCFCLFNFRLFLLIQHILNFTDTVPKSYLDLYEVIQTLGPEELQRLYEVLDIPQQDVKKAEVLAGTNDTNLKSKSVIRHWKKRNGKRATQDVLRQAVKRSTHIQTKETLEGDLYPSFIPHKLLQIFTRHA